MTKKEAVKVFYGIFLKYRTEIAICPCGCDDGRGEAYIENRLIFYPPKAFERPTEWDAFCLLHEIGHIKTNTVDMPDSECEFLATEWAAKEAKNWGIKVKKDWKDNWQSYIWSFLRKECPRERFNSLKEELVVRW